MRGGVTQSDTFARVLVKRNGLLHRIDGPAEWYCYHYDGRRARGASYYYIGGVKVPKKAYDIMIRDRGHADL